MAYRRKRRRRTVVWHVNQGYSSAETAGTPNYLIGGAYTPTGGYYSAGSQGATSLYRMVEDYPAEAISGSVQTGDDKLRGSGYHLLRIVGKLFVACNQFAEDAPPVVLVGAGLIVANSDETSGIPLQAATPAKYSPLLKPNERAPWIWRREWVLGNLSSSSNTGDWFYAPQTNMEYGSVMDGPHVDAKTHRKLGPRESLLFCFSVQQPQDYPFANAAIGARFIFNYRTLVVPMSAPMSNRYNASI